ncbi:MAG TPA: ribosome-associated translation inhibitor RaiA [Terriglobia bacterium]|nr:ribosome-associated translation inhibitor RaiA [Terriglobia bacterium]
MQIEYTGRQIEVTPDLRQYTEERIQKLARVLRDSCYIHVILAAAKHRRVAEITLKWRDHTLVGVEETTDPRTSINGALDKLEKQAVRLLQKRWTRKRRPGPTSAVRLNVFAPERDREKERKVLTERIPIKPLSMEEAIDSLEADTRELVVFRNVQTERVNIVYRRHDGSMVLIEPEP